MARVGVAISERWEEPYYFLKLADELEAERADLVCMGVNMREDQLDFVAVKLGHCARIEVPAQVSALVEASERLLLLGPKDDRRLRKIRVEAKRQDVPYRWRTKVPCKKIRVIKRKTIGKAAEI